MGNLAAFAKLLIDDHLVAFQKRCFQLYQEVGVPILKYVDGQQAEELSNEKIMELLTAFAENSVSEVDKEVSDALESDQFPLPIDRSKIVVADMILVAHARKKSFLEFVPYFTSDFQVLQQIVSEIDEYLLSYTSSGFKAFAARADQQINDQFRRLEENEKQFRKAESLTHIGNYVWDLASNELIWTDELYRIYELNPQVDTVTNEKIRAYNHPEDAAMIREHTDRARETGAPFDFYYRIVLKGGQIKTLHALGEVMVDQQGKSFRIFGTTQDVTERHQLLNQLQKNEQLYRQVESIAHVGAWYWNVEENIVSWTDELYRIYGLEPQSEVITFESYLTFVHTEDREMVIGTVRQSLETGHPYIFFHRIILRDGTLKFLHARGEAVKDAQGKVIQLVGSAQDVTVQKKTEAGLRENQNFIKKIANATPAIIATYYVDTGKYSFVNLGLKKNLNYDPREPLDNGVTFFAERIHPDDLPELIVKNQEILNEANRQQPGEEENVFEYQYRLKHQNGQYRWMHTYGTVFERTKTNQVKQILNISLDITERIEAERVILQRTRELQQSNASLEEFAYVASHDLNEPLRKISLFMERLSALRSAPSEEEKLYFDKIQDASARMRQMIDDILSLSLLSNKRTPEPTDLQQVLKLVSYMFEEQISGKGALIESDGLPVIPAIPSQIHQLFQNLISNSLKFCQPDPCPRINITHQYLTPSQVSGGLARASKYIKLTFSDNGIGFDNNFQEKIFAVFQRLHHKHQYEGTGIGLAICKKIVANHGGSITASGHPNKGAEFSIILPV